MKVTCPGCNASYNLDSSKIPESSEKVSVTCPKCKQKISVQVKKGAEKKPESNKPQDIIIPCPDCGHVNISTQKCINCGRVFTKEELENLKIGI